MMSSYFVFGILIILSGYYKSITDQTPFEPLFYLLLKIAASDGELI